MTVQLKLVRGTDAALSSYTGAEGEIGVSTTDYRVRAFNGVTPGGVPMALKSEVDAISVPTGPTGLPTVLAQTAAPKAAIAVAETFTAVTYDDNAGKVRFTSTGDHGLTTSPAVGAYIGVTWSTGVVDSYKILTVDSTKVLTVDLAYSVGLGTPVISAVNTAIRVATVTIAAGAMGANGAVHFDTGVVSSAGASKALEVRWDGYVDENTISEGTTLAAKWSLRNQGTETTNLYQYRESFIKDTLVVDTTVESEVILNLAAEAANQRVTLTYISAILWPKA